MFKALSISATRFLHEEKGATAIEYALVAAILAIAVVGTVGAIRDDLNDTFETVSGELAANNTP